MLKLSLGSASGPLRILCLGAHSDDIEIGCGGTLLRILAEHSNVHVDWVVFSANRVRKTEATKSAKLFLNRAKSKRVTVHSYRDGFFPFQGAKIKTSFEGLKSANPDLIFTHYRNDLHQDHRLINQLAWNTFRNHMILEYEIPKYDGDLGSPNVFFAIDESICRAKAAILDQAFATQRKKHWFSEGTFLALMRIRGVESCSPTRYAEAFYGRKVTLA